MLNQRSAFDRTTDAIASCQRTPESGFARAPLTFCHLLPDFRPYCAEAQPGYTLRRKETLSQNLNLRGEHCVRRVTSVGYAVARFSRMASPKYRNPQDGPHTHPRNPPAALRSSILTAIYLPGVTFLPNSPPALSYLCARRGSITSCVRIRIILHKNGPSSSNVCSPHPSPAWFC